MAIDSVLNPVGMAKKLSVPQLQKAIQDGIIPPYVGIPVLQEKVQMEERMRNAAAQPQQGQPTVAQQVMAQAQGLNAMQSGLPEQFAGGGIVAFAEGDLVEDEDEDDKFEKSIQSAVAQMDQYRKYMDALREMAPAGAGAAPSVETFPRFETQEVTKGMSVKEGDQPARSVEQTEKRVSRPGNLDEMLALVQQKESGGRRYDASGRLLTSPKGAMGEMQVMPGTARDPGFGIRPAREGDPDDLARVGREYFAKMLERYGDPKVAAIAYNMGPGNTDKWLMAGADMSRLPEETRNYAKGFAEGGVLKFAGRGLVPYVPQGVSSLDPYAWAAKNPAAAEATGLGIRALNRAFLPGSVGLGVYDIGRTVMEKKQKEELEKYGVEPEPTAEELERASKPAFYPSMSRQKQLGQGLKPLAPLTYTPAGAETYGERPGYTPPDAQKPIGPYTDEATRLEARYPKPAAPPYFADSDAAEQADRMTGTPEPQAAEAEKAGAEGESEFAKSLRDRLTRGYEKLAKQEESDKYLSLLAAGLGMMGGTSPFAAANIGAGGLKGIQAMQQAEASRAAQERALMSAELGLERYGQYGALQKEQALMRKQLTEAETQRKREATEGTLAERAERRKLSEQQMYGNQLKEMERLAQTAALAREKGAILPDQKEGIQAKALEQLRSDPGYRRLYKLVHGFDPAAAGGNTIQWDQLGK